MLKAAAKAQPPRSRFEGECIVCTARASLLLKFEATFGVARPGQSRIESRFDRTPVCFDCAALFFILRSPLRELRLERRSEMGACLRQSAPGFFSFSWLCFGDEIARIVRAFIAHS